jgi:hypothetical protein
MGLSPRKKHAFPACHGEDFTVDVHLHITRKNVEKLIFSRVDVGRWFVTPSHLNEYEIKGSVIVCGPRDLANEIALIPGRIG